MKKLAIIDFKGNFVQGFSATVKIWNGDRPTADPIAGKEGVLPGNSELLSLYKKWVKAYENYIKIAHQLTQTQDRENSATFALKQKAKTSNASLELDKKLAYENCITVATELLSNFNKWLKSSQFSLIVEELKIHQPQRILIESNYFELRKMPWQKWDFLESHNFTLTEVGLTSPNFQSTNVELLKTYQKLASQDGVKILVVLGKDANIESTFEKFQKFECDVTVVRNLPELDVPLWEKYWDILIFNGHSKTQGDGKEGIFQLSDANWLTISDIKGHFRQAINHNLKLAIFNSCDGLGLAYQLAEGEDLHLPQIIVMRENLPVVVAPKFLQFFLENYTQGLSLYSSLRESRQRLQILEKDFPCVSWLPVLYQNPAEIPPRWWELGGKIQISPYKGLSAFTENDTEIFFGRKVLINSLLSKVERQNLVAVIGASGSGKSSLVAAGLIPQWLAQATEFLPRFVVKIRPGFPHPNPWENLAEELGKISPNLTANDLDFLELVANLEANSGELAKCLTGIQQEKNGCQILLVIDQFEELYTLCSEDKRRSFLAGLVEAVRDDSWKIVLTLRADFLSQALDEDLGKIFDERDKLITPMNDEELTEAIALPAKKIEVEFADELIKRMIQDYRQNSGHLPMLQFALEELWKRQKYGVISLASYEEIGGLTQVLGDYAENIYCQLSQEEKEQARYIFTQLVQPISQEKSGEVSRIATRKIATFADIGKENWQLVIKFADERLVVTNKEKDVASVELIHEVLITAWSRLKKWIEQDWEFRRWQEKLRDNLSQWEQEKKDDFLLQGGLLKEAESWLEKPEQKIPEKEREYVDKSRKRRERERQKLIGGLTGGLVMVSLFAVGMVWQWQSAERQSLINEVDSLSNLALNQFQSGEGGISALMTAMDAGQKLKQLVKDDEKLGNYPTTRPLLALQTITSNIREKNEFQTDDLGNPEFIRQAFFTPDGKQMVSHSFAGGESKVIIWNLAGEKVTEWQIPERREITDLAISPNGKYIATIVGFEGKFYIWDFSGKKIAEPEPQLGDGYSMVKFSPNSQYIAVTTLSSKVEFFDFSGQKIKELKTGGSAIQSLEFTPNSEEIIIGSSAGIVEFWNLKTLEKIREFKANTNQVIEIDISPDGKQVLTLGVDINSEKIAGIAPKLWDLSGKKIADLGFFFQSITNTGIAGGVSFSPDGKQIAIAIPGEGAVRFYDATSGKLTASSTISFTSGYSLNYSPDSQIIAISGAEGINLLSNKAKFYVVELPTNYETETTQMKEKGFINLQYSLDGKKLVVISNYPKSNYVDIWDWQEREKRRINLGIFVKYEIFNKENNISNEANIGNKETVFSRIFKESGIQEVLSEVFYPDSRFLNSSNNFEESSFASVTPDGKFIIFVSQEGVKKVDLEGNLISQLKTNVNSKERILHTWRAGEYRGDRNYSSNLDGSKIATIGTNNDSFENTLRLWDLSTQEVKRFKNNSLSPTLQRVLVSPNGKYVFTTSSAMGKLWDASGNLLNPLDVNGKSLQGDELSMLAILLDVKKEKVGFRESGVRILDVWQNSTAEKAGLRSGDTILEIDGHKISDTKNIDEINTLLLGEPGTPVKLKVENRSSIKIEEKTIIREKFIYDISNFLLFTGNMAKFSPDSKYLATWDLGSENLSLRNIKTKKLVEINHQGRIVSVFFSPDSQLLATAGIDYSIKIWDFSGKLISNIKLEQIPSGALTFSPDSQQIAVLGHPNELSIWSIDGKQIAKHTVPEKYQGNIVFSPDSKYIATGASKVFIWQNKNLNELLATGCDWLQEYLTTRPQEKEKLKVCQEEVK